MWLLGASLAPAASDADRLAFFETEIRPLLAERCYECHNSSGKKKAGLALDHRAGMLKGGESGPIITPGKPQDSLILKVLAHARDLPKMPKGGPKFSATEWKNVESWIADGAFDPRDRAPTAADLAAETSWEVVRERRKQWWSFRPIVKHAPPVTKGAVWGQNSIDAFILAKLDEADFTPAPRADRRTLIRRLSFVLTGLPPTPEEVQAFLADAGEDAYERLVERLLASPRFGEKWARHWMDWLRYAESHGSEGDPRIPHANKYRDYLIRALNADVPYDQLVREHIAGDLLEKPRVNGELGLNESAIGPAHFRFVFHGFAPTDALDEQVRFTDNQIDVVSKTFLGLTVSCARCHNHKFDAISQADFYALYGIFASTRPAIIDVDAPGKLSANDELMAQTRAQLRGVLAEKWADQANSLAQRLKEPGGQLAKAIEEAKGDQQFLHIWRELRNKSGEDFQSGWAGFVSAAEQSLERLSKRRGARYSWSLQFEEHYAQWSKHGAGIDDSPTANGTLRFAESGDQLLAEVLPGGAYSGLRSTRLNGVFESPRMLLDGKYQIWARVAGSKGQLRYAVQNYPRNGTVYPVKGVNGDWKWENFGLDYWEGDHIHLELSTAGDSPVLARGDERSWVGLREVLLLPKGSEAPRDEMIEVMGPLLLAKGAAPKSPAELAEQYARTVIGAIDRWSRDVSGLADTRIMTQLLGAGVLANNRNDLPEFASRIDEWRKLEAGIPAPTRAPGVAEGDTFDQPLFERGDHKKPAEIVPRRFLEAFGGREYKTKFSGRSELAEDIIGSNPLAARVIANRLWHHLFGRGIVATPDNFGQLGARPSHPQLLDFLAVRMRESGWSMKSLIREIVLTETFRMRAGNSPADPENISLSHFPARRLEAEAIRDALLAVSGRLEGEMFGGSAGGDSNRRSVYVRVIRNRLDPFLRTFDAPEPLSTRGRRDATNVPAQSLTMMNSPFVDGIAAQFAGQAKGEPEERVKVLFERALGRLPSGEELADCLRFIEETSGSAVVAAAQRAKLESALSFAGTELAGLVDPLRERLLRAKSAQLGEKPVDPIGQLKPIAAWEFEDARDSVGKLDIELRDGAKLEGGALVLGSRGYALTTALERDIGAKTLEVWVQLDTLDQRNGGAMSLQVSNGSVFDAVVFGERQVRHWMSGSNRFERTADFAGSTPEDQDGRFIHLAITYAGDGTITGYRDGVPYGKPYKKGLHRFGAGNTNVAFGLRHSPASAGRLLKGRIDRARLYDRALSSEEIAMSAGSSALFVSAEEMTKALGPGGRAKRAELESRIADLQQQLVASKELAAPGDPWKELAHSILNLKEFIYLR